MVDISGRKVAMSNTKTPGQIAADRRQLLRRCNAAVPIPAAKHKRSRSWAKQQLREDNR